MSIKKVHDIQPEKFEFTKDNLSLANDIIKKYPKGRKKKCNYAITIFSTKSK